MLKKKKPMPLPHRTNDGTRISNLETELHDHEWQEQLLTLQSHTLELIATNHPLKTIFDSLLESIEKLCEGMSASILLLNKEELSLSHCSAPSLPDKYNHAIDGVKIGDNIGSCGTAAFKNEPVIVSNIDNDARWADFRELAMSFNLHACWSTPIQDPQGDVSGTFAMYYQHPMHPKDKDLVVIKLVTHLASIAIEVRRQKDLTTKTETMLKNSLERKNKFLAMLGHEIRNPLAVIVNGMDILSSEAGLNCKHRDVIDTIARQAHNTAQIVNDLLDVSRLGYDKLKIRRVPLSILCAIKDVVLDQRDLTKKEECDISLKLPEKDIFCSADPVRLSQCLVNLIGNSIKFSPVPCKIDISVHDIPARKRVQISVKDYGAGMTESTLKKIFLPFESGGFDNSNLDTSGLGLGLFILKSIVDIHGGTVSAFSEGLGCGSQFIIELATIDQTELEVDDEQPRATSKFQIRRLLIVEDNLDLLALLKRMLEKLGHQVYTAANATDGLSIAKKLKLDAIFCDIGLPENISGYDFAKQIRSNEQLNSLYMVAMTGFVQGSDRQKAKQAGFDFHLKKPVKFQTIAKVVDNFPTFD